MTKRVYISKAEGTRKRRKSRRWKDEVKDVLKVHSLNMQRTEESKFI